MRIITKHLLSLLLASLVLVGCSSDPYPLEHHAIAESHPSLEQQAGCDERNPQRNAYWGDTHVHTSISPDAYGAGVRVRPDDAYRYGFGGSLELPAYDSAGKATRVASIDRPLDFIAVTDHAEFMGESWLCTTAESSLYDSDYCKTYRSEPSISFFLAKHIFSPIGFRNEDACGADGAKCRAALMNTWQETIDAAEHWDDKTSACERSTFIAYEYSNFRMGSNLHRNVLFKNNVVMNAPISHIEEPLEWDLWSRLNSLCKETATGCDVLAIPHNSNISNGRMFDVDYHGAESDEEQVARAELRIKIEPIIEIMQHKGASECRRGIKGVLGAEDELCGFEHFEDSTTIDTWGSDPLTDSCATGWWGHWAPHPGPNCFSPLSYGRYALIQGLAEDKRIGVNPFKFGFTAATDTHNGMAGGVQERDYPGHIGMVDDSAPKRTTDEQGERGHRANSPGGLTGVWAEENNRAALFEAMQRKEVFGTSGPRIKPRFFGGWNYAENACDESVGKSGSEAGPEAGLKDAYARGVPMGGDLPVYNGGGPPVFLATAIADAGTEEFPGTDLQRLQVIKGWVDDEGRLVNRVYDVAGDGNNGATVNTKTCEQQGDGFAQLCGVWRDPDFDPARRAVYYLRAVENPSCRYDAWQCMSLSGEERPASCDLDTKERPKSIQERAWTSPIWYTPAASVGR